MALEGVAWLTANARHSADIGRMLAYSATNGATGVTQPSDFKVTQTPTASNVVNIAPGGATLLNRYPSGGGQSYVIRNQTQTSYTVSAAPAGGTLTRYLIAYVEDPQYGGASPTTVGGTILDGPYVKLNLVSTLTNILYPFIALARIDQPASTATVTTAMITDLRKLTNPRTHRELLVNVPTAGTLESTALIDYPVFTPQFTIPEWATVVKGQTNVQGLKMATGPTYGSMRLQIRNAGGTLNSASGSYDINVGSSGGNGARVNGLSTIIGVAIPSAMRGLTTTVASQMARSTAATDPGRLASDVYTQVSYDLWFTEDVV